MAHKTQNFSGLDPFLLKLEHFGEVVDSLPFFSHPSSLAMRRTQNNKKNGFSSPHVVEYFFLFLRGTNFLLRNFNIVRIVLTILKLILGKPYYYKTSNLHTKT